MCINHIPRRGYMLRDLLTGIVLIILTLSILLSGCDRGRRVVGDRAVTNNHLRQMGVAVHTAVGDYKRLPPSGTGVPTGGDAQNPKGGYGSKAGSLYFHLLPYVEQLPMYETGTITAYVPTFHAPSDPSENGQVTGTSFPFNGLVFNQGGNRIGKKLSTSMPDGTSDVIMFATGAIQSNDLRDAAAPDPVTCIITAVDLPQFRDWFPGKATLSSFQALDGKGIAVCMGDANTRMVSSHVSANSWKAAMIPNDTLNPGSDF